MKKIFFTLLLLMCAATQVHAASLSSLTWAQVCNGNMGDAWYGSTEAQNVADIVLYVQKTNGGWMKNDQLHKLTDSQKQTLYNQRSQHSCLDNADLRQPLYGTQRSEEREEAKPRPKGVGGGEASRRTPTDRESVARGENKMKR